VQLDAWNWEDAAYYVDGNLHFAMPSLLKIPTPVAEATGAVMVDPITKAVEQIEKVRSFLREAKAYNQVASHANTNLKFESIKGLFNKKQKLFIHCNIIREMLIAIDFTKEFGCDVVIVGGSESWQIADLLKQNNIAVILYQMHELPTTTDDDVDQPYKTPAMLQKAGVLFAINDNDGSARGRNLPFNAGTAVAYGLTKEEALTAITLSPARILGIANKTGSIEVGKDANIIISEGDILDMRSSIITTAFIQGRKIDLTDKHKLLNEKYKYKYGLK
jgi:imidazolonepropionase-like amidohydrolase